MSAGQQGGALHAVGQMTERDRADRADERPCDRQRSDPEVADAPSTDRAADPNIGRLPGEASETSDPIS